MSGFSNTIQDLELVDLPLQGAQFTWSRREDQLQASRIDGFLISPKWNECFKSVKQIALPIVLSDHKPILLESGDWEATPFTMATLRLSFRKPGISSKKTS